MGEGSVRVFPGEGAGSSLFSHSIFPYPLLSVWGKSSHLCQCLLRDFLRETDKLLEVRLPAPRYGSATDH